MTPTPPAKPYLRTDLIYLPPEKFKEEGLEQEQLRIRTRRTMAGFEEDAAKPALDDLVGLSLSGGGIRSASLNLGMLQAFYRYGLLRSVDYLSTVSGGSYIGCTFSSSTAMMSEPINPSNHPLLAPGPDGAENERIKLLRTGGQSLNQPSLFVNNYLIGLVKINSILLTALLVICLTVATCWRFLDEPPVCEILLYCTGNMFYEVVRPFLIPLVLLFAWILCWTVRAREPGRIVQIAIAVGLFAIALGWSWCEERGYLKLLPDILLWQMGRPVIFLAALAWPISCWWTAKVCEEGKRATFTFRSWRGMLGLMGLLGGLGGTLYFRYQEIWGGSPLYFEKSWWVFLRPIPFVLMIACPFCCWGGLRLPMRIHHKRYIRIRMLLMIAGLTFLVAGAVWMANPNINLASPSKEDIANTNRLTEHRTVVPALLGTLLAALLPLVKPQRLLESGLRPKAFWEPWVFNFVCAALFFGVPLAGIYGFASHNWSGAISRRSPELLVHDIAWKLFCQQYSKERLNQCWWMHQCLDNEQACADKIDQLLRLNSGTAPRPTTLGDEKRDQSGEAKLQREILEAINRSVFENPKTREEFYTYPPFPELRKSQEDQQSRDPALTWPKWPQMKALFLRREKLDLREEQREVDRALNRLLLEAQFPFAIYDLNRIRRSSVILEDQFYRLCGIAMLVLLLLVTGTRIAVNAISLHELYSSCLAQVYLPKRFRPVDTPLEADLATAERGGPYHLVCAALNTAHLLGIAGRPFRNTTMPDESHGKRATPAQAPPKKRTIAPPTDMFIFSELYCGSPILGYRSSSEYQGAEIGLNNVLGLSGAAFSPVQVGNPLIMLLMAIFNVRLGQWLPNVRPGVQWDDPTVLDLLRDHGRDPGDRQYFFLSDGGHHENLGLEVLLQRRCRLIVVSDATCDPSFGFADFLRVCRRVRLEQGIEFVDVLDSTTSSETPVVLDRLRPPGWQLRAQAKAGEGQLEDRLSPEHYFVAKIRYPDEGFQNAYLIYLKSSLTGDEANDLLGHSLAQGAFPHDPTSNQLYDPDKFESYRQLGYHLGEQLCRDLDLSLAKEHAHNLWETRTLTVHDLVETLIERRRLQAKQKRARETAPTKTAKV